MVARTARVRAVCTSNGGTALEAPFSQPRLRLDRCNQWSGPHDVNDAREIVSEDVERHLGGHAWQPFHQEVGCSHPRLERPERMLDRFAPLAHLFRVLVEPALQNSAPAVSIAGRWTRKMSFPSPGAARAFEDVPLPGFYRSSARAGPAR